MKKSLFLLFMFFIFANLNAQNTATCYRLALSDKKDSPFSISKPEAYLSQRALDKRARFNIQITEQDLPVNPQYISQITAIDSQIRVLCHSKWMNTVTIYCPDSAQVPALSSLPFVSSVTPVGNYIIGSDSISYPFKSQEIQPQRQASTVTDSIIPYNYGYGYDQIAIHNGQKLHDLGFRGDSMLIVVFDAGWEGFDTSKILSRLYENGQIWGTRDLMPLRDNVYEGHSHGTLVSSTIGALQEGVFVGTAPEANFYFIRSENPDSEEPIEEDYWAYAAEIADSLGADVINSSLGYVDFENFPEGNYTYEAIDGKSSIASLAATILGQKGVVVCVSAGNEGDSEWHRIGHPADAYDILTVGAVSTSREVATFSSRGPSFDGRVKPDISSVGYETYCVWPGDIVYTANGTSLSCPVAAGLCACLWQALPEKSAAEIMQIIRESSSCYSNPNDSLGYGIPDFYAAYMTHHTDIQEYTSNAIRVYPNPCSTFIHIPNVEQNIASVEVFSISGVLLKKTGPCNEQFVNIDLQNLSTGMYIGKIILKNGQRQTFKVVKK